MKFTITLLTFLLTFSLATEVYSQKKVREKDLVGTWKLIFKIEEGFEEAKEELDDDNSVAGRVILSAVEGLVSGILEEVEIYMEFQRNGKVQIVVNAFGEEDIDYAEWYINNDGRLYISDTENYESDDDDFWMFEDDVLVNFDEKLEQNKVYLVRI